MIQEKELERIPKCLDDMELVPLELWRSINHNVIEAGITGFARNDEDSISFKIKIKHDDLTNGYVLEGYSATLLHVGEISHQYVNGVDTALIEDAIKKFDWQKITPVMLKEQPEAAKMMDRLLELHGTNDQRGMDIAMLLVMKYFVGTPLGLVFDFPESKKNYETSLFIDLNGNGHDLNLKDAYRLLCGRGVARSVTPDGKSDTLCWMTMENGKVVKVDDFNVVKCISALPFHQPRSVLQLAEDIAEMTAGNQCFGKFRIDSSTFHAYYEPDPLNGTIALRDLKQNKLNLLDLKRNPDLINALPRKKNDRGRQLGL